MSDIRPASNQAKAAAGRLLKRLFASTGTLVYQGDDSQWSGGDNLIALIALHFDDFASNKCFVCGQPVSGELIACENGCSSSMFINENGRVRRAQR